MTPHVVNDVHCHRIANWCQIFYVEVQNCFDLHQKLSLSVLDQVVEHGYLKQDLADFSELIFYGCNYLANYFGPHNAFPS